MKKIFYSDVDDTILVGKDVNKNLEKMFDLINKRGDQFIPASGRPLQSMIKTFSKYPINYLIAYNGAEIYDLQNKKYIYNNILSKEEIIMVLKYLKEINLEYLIYENTIIKTSTFDNEYIQLESRITNLKLEKIDSLDNVVESPKILGIVDPIKMEEALLLIKNKFPELEAIKSKPFFIEITKKEVSKGTALKKLSERNGYLLENITCFGDSYNDLSMFELPITKVAVENAENILKEKATTIVESCENDGVPKYIFNLYGEEYPNE